MKLLISKLFCLIIVAAGQVLASDTTCVVEDEFEAMEDIVFESSVPADELTEADLAALAEGIKTVYNDMQAGICDDDTMIIETVHLSVVDRRRLTTAVAQDEEGRDLQYNFEKFFMFILMLTQGSCRGCPSYSFIFDDASRRLGREKSLRSNSLEAKAKIRGNSKEFMKNFDKWIKKEQKTGGKLQSVKLHVESVMNTEKGVANFGNY